MKSLNAILLVGAVAASFTLATQAKAGDKILLSPKARQMQASLQSPSGQDADMLDRSVKGTSPRQLAAQESLRTASSREKDMLARNAILGNARAWQNNPAGPPTSEPPVNVAPSK